jgi:hypothetical protein
VRGRGAALAAVIVGVVVLGVWWLGEPGSDTPLDPRSHAPGGTSALVTLLEELGARVDVGTDLPGDATEVTLLMADRLDGAGRDDLEAWVRGGGVLVVSDPGSPLSPAISSGGPVGSDVDVDGGVTTTEISAQRCDIAALDGLDRIVASGLPAVGNLVGLDDQSCFGDGDVAYVVAQPEGRGTIVALAGSGILVNRTLGEADNAPVAAALLAPEEGTRVTVLDPTARVGAGGGDESLIDLVPGSVKRALVQLGVAFLVYVLWRARRLGRPVEEPQPVKVAGSELVSAVGGLLERSRSPQHAADVLRAELRRDLTTHLGLPPALPPENFVGVVMARTSLDAEQARAAVGPGPVTDDHALLAVVRLIDYVRQEVLHHVRT